MPEKQWNPVKEVRANYPGLKDWSDDRILENLSDPQKFRSAFPQYGKLTDDVIRRNIGSLRSQSPESLAKNTIDPKTGKGYGLYAMSSPEGQTYQIPYNNVMTATQRGFTTTQADRERYARDLNEAHMQELRQKNLGHQANLSFRPAADQSTRPRVGQPTPLATDLPKANQPTQDATPQWWQQVRQKVQGATEPKEKQQWTNFAKRVGAGLFGMADFPVAAEGAVIDAVSDDPDVSARGVDTLSQMLPPQMVIDRVSEFKNDWKKDPNAAMNNLGADAVTFFLSHKAGQIVGKRVPTSLGELRQSTTEAVTKPVRGTLEAMSKTGPLELRKMAQETVKKNADAAKLAADQNAEAAKKHLIDTKEAVEETKGRELSHEQRVRTVDEEARVKYATARLEVAKKNKEALIKHAADVDEVQRDNQAVLRDEQKRVETQQKLTAASQELEQKVEKARVKAKADDDKAWADWRTKIGTTEAPSNEIVDQINASKSTMDPEDVAEFRKVLKETKPAAAEAGEVQETKDSIAKNQGAGSYAEASPTVKAAIDDIVKRIGLDPDEMPDVKAVSAPRLHVWKTQLEYAVRNATRGNVRYAIGQVLDKVRDTESKLSEEAGAGAELEKARKLHGPYKDTFVNSPNEPLTVASKAVSETSPEYAKEKARANRLKMLGEYDATIPTTAEHIDNLREGLTALPNEGPLRDKLKPLPPPPQLQPEPTPPVPARQTIEPPFRAEHPDRPEEVVPERKTLTREELETRFKENLRKSAENLREISVRRAIYSSLSAIPTMILSTLLGHPGYAIAELVAAPTLVLGGGSKLAGLLERPAVVNWLTEVTPQKISAIRDFPPAERAVIDQNLRDLVQAAQKKGIRVSPALTAFAASAAATSMKQRKSLRQLRQEAAQRQQGQVVAQ